MVTVLDETKEYDDVWRKVDSILEFRPSCEYRGHSLNITLPFNIKVPYVVFAIDSMKDDLNQMDELVRNAMINCSGNKEWYALDWQHSAFRFNPCNKDEMNSVWIEDEKYIGGGYNAFFPAFYPDGDYYFFIDTDFENGYLGHPWRLEVWIFGIDFIDEINKIADGLKWRVIEE